MSNPECLQDLLEIRNKISPIKHLDGIVIKAPYLLDYCVPKRGVTF